ncbi:MAG: hypothetical protein DME65_15025 [Verrucomicrobia bacterium]|nr:MAG: hypothetical protein DME65_15025 [Verrucomicrobiota bacterium]
MLLRLPPFVPGITRGEIRIHSDQTKELCKLEEFFITASITETNSRAATLNSKISRFATQEFADPN